MNNAMKLELTKQELEILRSQIWCLKTWRTYEVCTNGIYRTTETSISNGNSFNRYKKYNRRSNFAIIRIQCVECCTETGSTA